MLEDLRQYRGSYGPQKKVVYRHGSFQIKRSDLVAFLYAQIFVQLHIKPRTYYRHCELEVCVVGIHGIHIAQYIAL